MSTIGERLRRAIDEYWDPPEGRRASIREFSAQMEERDAPGHARQTIHNYLADDAEPSLEFFREAADLLGVREEWLALGSGPVTEGEARARADVEGVSRSAVEAEADAFRRYNTMEFQRAVLLALGRGHPPVPEPPEGFDSVGDLGGDEDAAVRWREAVDRSFRSRRIHPWAPSLAEAKRRLNVASGGTLDDPVRFPLDEAPDPIGAEDVGRALRFTLAALDVDPALMSHDALDGYVLAMVPALLALAPERQRQAPMSTTPEERLEGTRRDLAMAREDDLSAEIIERLEKEVRRLEALVDAHRDEEE